jgi:hypothetical protein
MAGPSRCLCIDSLEGSGIREALYCDTDSEEELDRRHILSENSQDGLAMMNCNGEAKFVLIKHVHISLWENRVYQIKQLCHI